MSPWHVVSPTTVFVTMVLRESFRKGACCAYEMTLAFA